MSINHIGPEEINRRKTISDARNSTEELTFPESANSSPRETAYLKVRNEIDNIEDKALNNIYGESYYNDLFEE